MATDDSAPQQVAWEVALENLVTRLRTLGPTDPDTIAALPNLAASAVTPRGVHVLAKIYARGALDAQDLRDLSEDGLHLHIAAETVRLSAVVQAVRRSLADISTALEGLDR